MTKNIRKAAPEGAEYFRIAGDCIEDAKIDSQGNLCEWNRRGNCWQSLCLVDAKKTIKLLGFHAFEAPKWIWFALGGLFGSVIVGLLL